MSIKNVFNEEGGTVPSTGGGADAGTWTSLGPADLQTNAQSYSTFTLSDSPVAGFNNRISIANNAVGVFNNFPQADVGVVFFDTGFGVDDLGDGDFNNAVLQIVWEPAGMQSGSTYQTDIAYPLGVCLFSSLTAPPFNTGLKGGFYGHGFLHTKSGSTLIANDSFPRRMRSQTSAGLRGAIYTYGDPFQSLLHTVTAAQGLTGAGAKAICLTQGDFNAFINNTSAGKNASLSIIGQNQDNTFGFSTDAADTVRLGVMFNMFIDTVNGGVNPSPVRTWDFNLKFRKLNAT
tara:strand:- start:200 stop:1066 length:867 start_codon:yes stop_codon:yes gene_type:complete